MARVVYTNETSGGSTNECSRERDSSRCREDRLSVPNSAEIVYNTVHVTAAPRDLATFGIGGAPTELEVRSDDGSGNSPSGVS